MDPFAHHPDLRGRIADPAASRFRSFQPASFDATMAATGQPPDWRFSDAEREHRRRALLGPRLQADLWVFAYGSLMWDPGFHFAEVRVGHLTGWERRFCLRDTAARDTPAAPGLQAGLLPGAGCTGLAFRIPAELADPESEVVWRREALAPVYTPLFLRVDTAQGAVEALTFVANPGNAIIVADLTRAQEVEYLATGAGHLGTSREYLENVAAQFAALGIDDPAITALLAEVRAFAD